MNESLLDEARPLLADDPGIGPALGWLEAHVPGFGGSVEVQRFGRGFSNHTYLLRARGQEWVLRCPPPGVKIKTAHDMGREFRILSGLAPVWPKVPRPVAFCEDGSLLGGPFYVMERVRGVILRGRAPRSVTLEGAPIRRVSEALIDTLVEIHSLDLTTAKLKDLGKPEGYVSRQVAGWTERYEKAQTDDLPQMAQVSKWLSEHVPVPQAATLIHNDFKYDNVVLDLETMTRVLAVLDWEMATVGDPLMDLGTVLGYWPQPGDPPIFLELGFGLTATQGNLTRAQVVERYAERTGRDVSQILFYFVFALWKIGVVAQQLYRRYRDGLTREERFGMALAAVICCAENAVSALERNSINSLGG